MKGPFFRMRGKGPFLFALIDHNLQSLADAAILCQQTCFGQSKSSRFYLDLDKWNRLLMV